MNGPSVVLVDGQLNRLSMRSKLAATGAGSALTREWRLDVPDEEETCWPSTPRAARRVAARDYRGGGKGAIWRTALGMLLLALIANAFNILNVKPQYQATLTCGIIVAVVALNSVAARR
jgi:hypothetical protein